jgi:hypothetical protein
VVEKTTVYLPAETRRALKKLAARLGKSEADIIREALAVVAGTLAPRPRLPLGKAVGPSIAEDIDGALDGFGR